MLFNCDVAKRNAVSSAVASGPLRLDALVHRHGAVNVMDVDYVSINGWCTVASMSVGADRVHASFSHVTLAQRRTGVCAWLVLSAVAHGARAYRC